LTDWTTRQALGILTAHEVVAAAPDYYALFVFDPDGVRVEVFYWQRAATVD
jgi:hypothetical protein